MKKVFASVVALAAVGAVPAFAGEALPETGKIGPESATLPANVARFRAVYGYGWGNQFFDKDGKKQDALVEFVKTGGAAVVEYGITDKISGQFLVPFAFEPSYEVNNDYVEKEDVYLALASANPLSQVYGTPVANLKLASADQKAAILAGVKTVIEDTAKKTKTSGLGDVEIGAKYNLSSEAAPIFEGIPFYASAALGVRFNTSGYAEAAKDGKLPVGRGTTDLGIRLNADYLLFKGAMVQLENQAEFMLMKGETYSGGNKVDYERDGVRNVGYGKLVVAPGAWVAAIDVLSLGAKYAYNFDAKTKTDGKTATGAIAPESQNFVGSVSLNGFTYGVPLQLDVDYTMPISGKGNLDANRLSETAVASSVAATLKAFYKF